MRRLLGFLACAWFFMAGAQVEAESAPALLMRLSSAPPTTQYVIPGTLAPHPGGAPWPTCATLGNCPSAQGAAFATEEPTVTWDLIPGTIYSGNVSLCALGAGLSTSPTVSAGKVFGLGHFDVQVNGGPIKTTTAITTATPSGYPGACVTLRTSDLGYDGPFQVRGIWYPVDGKPAILQSPDTGAAPCFADCSITLNGNAGGTLLWAGSTVYADPAGTDGVGCGTATGTSACKTPCGALDQLHRNSITAGKGGDLSNTTVGFVNATWTSLNCSNSYNTATGWVYFVPAPGASKPMVIFTDTAANGPHVQNIWYGITWAPTSTTNGINNGWKTGSTGAQVVLNGPDTGAGQHWNILGPFQPGRWSRTFVVDAQVSEMAYGCQQCYFVRNLTASQIGSDALNNVQNFFNVHALDVSPNYASKGNTASGSTDITGLTTTSDMQVGMTILSNTAGCLNSTTIAAINSSTEIHTVAAAAASCTATNFYSGAHPDTCQIQNTTSHNVWFGFYTDGDLTHAGTVDAQGCPFVGGLPVASANNFALYDVNSFISNNGRTNFQLDQSSDNWVVINSSWGGGAFNRVSVNPTNFEMINPTCEAVHPGTIGTGGGGITYYNNHGC